MGWALLALSVLTPPMLAGPVGAQAFCRGDYNRNGAVEITDVLSVVREALDGCVPEEPPVVPGPCLLSGEGTGPFEDHGDGTVTDSSTGLRWELKSDDGGIHDRDNRYSWSLGADASVPDGTMVTEFLAGLNSPPCFAGFCDWRIPSRRELATLVDSSRADPAVAPTFHAGCVRGCSLPTCRCTSGGFHWTATSVTDRSADAWGVTFSGGFVGSAAKVNPQGANLAHVRAVRGGR